MHKTAVNASLPVNDQEFLAVFSSGYGLDPDSNGLADPDPGRPKFSPKKEMWKFRVL